MSLLNCVTPIDNTPPQHKERYEQVEYQGKQVYIFLNYDSNDCLTNARYILEQVPAEKKKVPAAVEGSIG